MQNSHIFAEIDDDNWLVGLIYNIDDCLADANESYDIYEFIDLKSSLSDEIDDELVQKGLI